MPEHRPSTSSDPARRVKILATLGPATATPGVLERLVDAGLDAVRINLSHGTEGEWRSHVAAVRGLAEAAGRPITVLMDLGGPKIRLAQDTVEREVAAGEELVLCALADRDRVPGAVGVEWDGFASLVVPGRSELVVGDGAPRLLAHASDGAPARVRAGCTIAGRIGPRRGLSVTHSHPAAPSLTPKDLRDLDVAAGLGADAVALSFVRTGADVRGLRAAMRERGMRARVVAKIEKAEACANLEEIVAEADGVMVARGDLGVEVGVAHVPLLQKRIIRTALAAGRLVITATQMLESMIHAPQPTRAEAADVANAVLDGTSALMLSAETAIGRHPEAAVRAMAEIARAAEAAAPQHRLARPETAGVAVMQAAVLLADTLRARALVVPTASGNSARAAAACRPGQQIVALAHSREVANQLALEWGVLAGEIDGGRGTIDEFLVRVLDAAGRVAGLPLGERVVVTSGPAAARVGSTNLIVIERIGKRPSLDPAWLL